MKGHSREILMQNGNYNGEEGVKFDILLHSHEDCVSPTLGAGAIFSYMVSTIIVSEQI